MTDATLLAGLLVIPALGGLLVAVLPAGSRNAFRGVALGTTLVTFAWSLLLWSRFDPAEGGMQLVTRAPWIHAGGFEIAFHVGIDGISLLLVLLTTFLMPLSVLGSWSIREHLRGYMALMLFLEASMIGVFIALDLVLFYFFWEAMLIPMYFLIGIWGGERRIYAAIKFFLYTAVGSLLMLAALIALYYYTGAENFDLVRITGKLAAGEVTLPPHVELWMFLAFFLAFAIKVPLFPFHTWLPDAHVEAPTAGSVILAGILLKMGTYGLLRFCLPLFPAASVQAAPWICWLAIIGILYGALVAMVQPDVKKLVAYSSVSHLGFVVLGIFAFNLTAMAGAGYQMLNHGVSTGALFLLVGMIYDRRHTREIAAFGGLAHRMPVYAACFLVIALSSIGLPGLNGFVGEFLVLQGTFLENHTYAAFAALAVIFAAVYMLWMYQRVFMGRLDKEENRNLQDLCAREVVTLLPLILMAIWMGVASPMFISRMEPSLQKVLDRIETVQEGRVFRVDNRNAPVSTAQP
ncbi:MAG: NADH-quinone oxidoreductase subunit M [Acidobacteriota bacterium]